jgi:hypothetical protein
VSVTATDTHGGVSQAATALVVVSGTAGDSIAVSGGGSAGQVSISTTDEGNVASSTPPDQVLVAGSSGSTTYTVNFGSTLTTPITLVGTGNDTLVANGDGSSTNVITKTPGQITWGSPVTETVYRSGIPNTTINANGTSQNYVNDPGGSTTINGGPGANTILITATTGSGVVINGGPTTNSYVIDLGSLAGPVTINNSHPSATNSLTVNGAAGNNSITASGSQVTAAGQAAVSINPPLAGLTINGGGGSNQITVSNLTVPVQSLALNGAGTSNSFTLVNAGTNVGSLAVNGGGSGTTQVQVQGSLPANVQAPHLAPIVSAGGGATLNEGGTLSRTGSFLDSDTGLTYAATVDYGDGSGPQPLTLNPDHTFALSHVFADEGSYPVTVTVSDGQGDTGSATFILAALNVPPSVGTITAPQAPVPVNTAVSPSASFTDPGIRDTHTAVWNWGDGSTSAGTVTESNGSGSVSGSHSYAVDGVYTITLTVTDDDGASGSSSFSYVVVYNPSAGFVTGGGWFNSPAGADAANPSLTGKANFGFNAKYKSGATVPTGDTEFQFPAANLDLHSTSYDWLVVNGAQAQFQGSGTINGAGNYGFLVTAVQGSLLKPQGPDALRIQIWDKNNGNAVVYDSQPGAATTAAPTTALGGGAIQIHANPNGLQLTGIAAPTPAAVPALTPAELAPVVQEAKAEWRATGLDAAQLAALDRGAVYLTALPAPYLGLAAPGAAWINVTAAGLPWFLDPSPATDALFAAGLVRGQVDLLTVVAHELGHVLGLDYEGGEGIMTGSLVAGVRLYPQASDLLGPQGASGTGSPTSGALPAAALPPSVATPVAVSRGLASSPALAGAAGGTEGLLLFPAGVALAGDPGVAPSAESAGVPSLPGADALAALIPLADWTGRSALGFGHGRRDLAAGDPGGADAEEGPDVDRVDLFFSSLEGDLT